MSNRNNIEVFQRVQEILAERKKAGVDVDSSYVASLYAKGTDGILRKVAEECTETILAAKSANRLHLVQEITDLWFHTMVLLVHLDLSVDDVAAEMRRREGISGVQVKAARSKRVH